MSKSAHWEKHCTSKNLGKPPISIPEPLWEVFFHRHIRTESEIDSFLKPQLKELTNPYKMNNMDVAVERLISCFNADEKICIYADFDLDGTPGLALLYDGLKGLGFKDIIYYQPKRLKEGYGVHSSVMKDLKAQGVHLIVTVDVGITDLLAVDYANELGLDVIITDHHLPKNDLPKALAILNPNTLECKSGLGHLCGTGVAFYLILALKIKFKELNILPKDFDPKKLLDCFAIATITDMVPLVKENRVLVKHGLAQLSKTQRPGLKLLLQSLGLYNKEITTQDVSFKFAPKLNALSRMEKGLLPIDIFMVKNENKAHHMISEIFQNNDLRIKLQKKAEKVAQISHNENPNENFVWVWSPLFHKGIIGLVATKMAQKYSLPAFVGTLTEDNKIVGSSRLPQSSHLSLIEILNSAEKALTKFGGHKAAAGFELKPENSESFKKYLTDYFSQRDEETVTESVIKYHGDGKIEDFTPQFMKWYEAMGPFGMEFESPVFLVKEVVIKSVNRLKGGHCKLIIGNSKKQMAALWFSPPKDHDVDVDMLQDGQFLDLLLEPQWNDFNGNRSLQALIKDIRYSQ